MSAEFGWVCAVDRWVRPRDRELIHQFLLVMDDDDRWCMFCGGSVFNTRLDAHFSYDGPDGWRVTRTASIRRWTRMWTASPSP